MAVGRSCEAKFNVVRSSDFILKGHLEVTNGLNCRKVTEFLVL